MLPVFVRRNTFALLRWPRLCLGNEWDVSTLVIDETMLDAFILASDRRGGPNSPGYDEFWRTVTYKTSVILDERLDPFGDGYMAAQLRVYAEISGRTLDQAANEMTSFDLPAHVAAANPYGNCDPASMALHIQRLSRAIMAARPRMGGAPAGYGMWLGPVVRVGSLSRP